MPHAAQGPSTRLCRAHSQHLAHADQPGTPEPLLGTGQGAQLTAEHSPPPQGEMLHTALNHPPPLRAWLPVRGRLAPSLRVGTDQSVVFVEAERNGDINIKSDFSLSNALSVSMGVGKDVLTSLTPC